MDEPIFWYEGSGTSDRRWLLADPLGSVIAVSNGAGTATTINAYDEYGQPGAANAGRFQYAGALALPEAGLLSMRARAYDPALGRFLQTDPILTEGGINLYAYVGNDPVNFTDPFGLGTIEWTDCQFTTGYGDEIILTCTRHSMSVPDRWVLDGRGPRGEQGDGGDGGGGSPEETPAPARQCGVTYVGIEGAAAEGFGVAGGIGVYHDRATGNWGWYTHAGGAVGGGASATVGGGFFSSMNAFRGTTASLNGGLGIDVSLSGSWSPGSGWGAGGGVGLGGGVIGTSTYNTPRQLGRFNARPVACQGG